MTTSDKLDALIQKSIDNGWRGILYNWGNGKTDYYPDSKMVSKYVWDEENQILTYGRYDDYEELQLNTLIFNHDFAKALFGEELCEYNDCRSLEWQYHLQQAVISNEPIDYMYEEVFGNE